MSCLIGKIILWTFIHFENVKDLKHESKSTAHNWQKWKRTFLTFSDHKVHGVEAVVYFFAIKL